VAKQGEHTRMLACMQSRMAAGLWKRRANQAHSLPLLCVQGYTYACMQACMHAPPLALRLPARPPSCRMSAAACKAESLTHTQSQQMSWMLRMQCCNAACHTQSLQMSWV